MSCAPQPTLGLWRLPAGGTSGRSQNVGDCHVALVVLGLGGCTEDGQGDRMDKKGEGERAQHGKTWSEETVRRHSIGRVAIGDG
eukprot:scaffold260718_cov41-Tisochrysis_lutea.AAC.3